MPTADLFSNFNLQMLNLWVGLCRGEAGLPSDLRALGFKAKWIELEFQNSKGSAVKPELIIASDQLGHALLMEWKEGQNADRDQLRRYADVTPGDLVQKAALSTQEAKSADTCLLGLDDHSPRLTISLDEAGLPFPLLSVASDGISLAHNRFAEPNLTDIFYPKLPIKMSRIPTQLIPFDHNSETWEIAERVMPQVVRYMTDGLPRFTLDQLAKDTVPVWDALLSDDYQRNLKVKIQQVVHDASRHEFAQYIRRDQPAAAKRGGPTWDITYNPTSLPFDKRTREFQKLKTLQADLIEALRTNKRNPLQLSLGL